MNKFLGILVALIVVVGAILYFAYSSLGGIVEAAIERYGSEITETNVAVDSVDIDAASGEASLTGLNVGSPAGFKADHTFNLGNIAIAMDPASIASDTVTVEKIDISAPSIWYEMGGDGSNIAAIQKSVENYMAQFDTGSESTAAEPSEEVKLIIEDLYIRDAKVNVGTTLFPGKKVTVGLPEVHLTDIGKDKGGASAGEGVDKIMDALTPQLAKAAGNIDPGALLEAFGDQAGDFAGLLEKGVLGDGGKLAEELTEGLKGKLGSGQEMLEGVMQEGSGAATEMLEGAADDTKEKVEEGMKGAGDAMKGLLGQ